MDDSTRRRVIDSSAQVVDAMRLSDRQRQELLEDLDRRFTHVSRRDLRQSPRIQLDRAMKVIVQLHHPGGSVGNYVVQSRNLSTGGIGFLHGSFVHLQTPCVAILLSLGKQWIAIRGKIVRCSHVSGRVHDIGMQFDEPIELSDFVHIDSAA